MSNEIEQLKKLLAEKEQATQKTSSQGVLSNDMLSVLKRNFSDIPPGQFRVITREKFDQLLKSKEVKQ